jgi:membrane fusion protein (multidrug efflux system)
MPPSWPNPLRVGLSMQVTVDTRSGPAGAAGVATTAAQ